MAEHLPRPGRPRPGTTSDRVRSVGLATAAAAMILVPTLGARLAGTDEGAQDHDTDVTPPDYAFAVWGPIFAGAATVAAQHVRNPTAPVNRHAGWWLAGSFTANTVWSLAAQSGRFGATPFILPVAAGLAAVAHRSVQDDRPRGAERVVAPSSGLLLGWTAVASVVNVLATRRGRLAPTTSAGRQAARVAAAGAAVALSTVVARSRQGGTPVGLAGVWALGTTAADRTRTVPTRWVSAAGAGLIAGTTATTTWTARRRNAARP